MSEASIKTDGRSRPRSALLLGLGLVLFLILLVLGTWQMQRLYWKEGLLQTIDQRTHSAPLPLVAVEKEFAATGDVDYTPVTVTGTFLHQGERHFYATWEGDAGFNVYTPLALDDGRFVLINRGFVPYDLKDAAKRAKGQVAGSVTVTGLARNPLPGKPSMMLPDNDVAKNIFYWKDRDVMAASAGLPAGAALVPIFIDADKTPNPG
ncbi:SURF1 family protein, partial [Mesorhizobium sp. M7A.F.Ca.CA.002.05.1.1]